MKRLYKFLCLIPSDRYLLVNTFFLLGLIRLGLWLLPFQTLQRFLMRMAQAPSELKVEQSSSNRVVWAVTVASRCMPGEVKCLAQALATQVLLGRRGHTALLRIGVAKDEGGSLEAHAWVESQGRVVIGGSGNLSRYTLLPPLSGGKL